MRVLLDTQLVLWLLDDSPRLGARARALIEDADVAFLSAASHWDVSIKRGLGKIEFDPERLLSAIDESGLVELPVTSRHAAAVATLPPYHRDPFDRLLVAQAITEPLHLLTTDHHLPQYSSLVIHI